MRELRFLLVRLTKAITRRVGRVLSTAVHSWVLDDVGAGTTFDWGCRLYFPGRAEIGNHCHFGSGVETGTDFSGALLRIGNYVNVNRNVHLDVSGGLEIGDRSLISEQVMIYTHDHGYDPRSVPKTARKVIGEDVWIGVRAVLLPECRRVGDFAIIGAGAVVARDVPDGAIVVGNPARRIGTNPTMGEN